MIYKVFADVDKNLKSYKFLFNCGNQTGNYSQFKHFLTINICLTGGVKVYLWVFTYMYTQYIEFN